MTVALFVLRAAGALYKAHVEMTSSEKFFLIFYLAEIFFFNTKKTFCTHSSSLEPILPRYHAERFHEIASACANQCNVCRRSDWSVVAVWEDFFLTYSFIQQLEWTNHCN